MSDITDLKREELAADGSLPELKEINEQYNGVVLVDYENIFRRLQDFGKNIVDVDFVGKMKNFFKEKGVNITDFIVYANFDVDYFHRSFHQSYLQTLGVTTRHTSNKGKNSSDIQLVVDAMKILFRNKLVDVFVIVSSDRDMIPLIQAINQEDKRTFLITTTSGFDKSIIYLVNYHEYLENILDLRIDYLDYDKDCGDLNSDDIESAKEIIYLLITSKIWENFRKKGTPINYREYIKHLAALKKTDVNNIDTLFKVAAKLRWIKFYEYMQNTNKVEGIRPGERLPELLKEDIFQKHFISFNKD